MIYLSLFNGISAGRLALSRAGIKFDKYYIAEIDKFANKVSEFHYPDNIQLGDVNNWREWDIDWSSVGLVTAGFPCQSWSLAGKQLGDKDERGKLFWTTLEIMSYVLENNPDAKFMLENVKMKKEFEEYITLHTERALGYVNKTLINSSLLSAQNRQRYYWTNFEVSQPEDKGILLKDIIDDVNSHGFKNNKAINKLFNVNPSGKGMNGNVYSVDGVSPTLTTNKGEGIKIAFRPCEPRERIKQSKDGLIHVANASDIRGNESMLRVYSDAGKAPTLSTCQGGHREPKVATDNVTYRKLTPTECARLQTFPDGWCENVVSNSQSYKCYGNAWTVDVIAHIFKCAYIENKHEAIRPAVNYEQSCSANI
ncbi:DNA (cytosine-5-)-methyltransferase [Proteus terrae]|uniref:DNA (cytosine-5-)-methyltransferase n=1 Tax=Proteus terrae subsp. cibarius TaxID=626774 RepID=A0A8I0WSJ0_9GAMM|nr:DNA (cytosine-5-)-methyltransferase [Proteus terrae]MBG2915728.1 DNA (cytosine-5-)-methyltransferase [Proteus terrae subsp. cibarius]